MLPAACLIFLLPSAAAHLQGDGGSSAGLLAVRWLEASPLLIGAVVYAAGVLLLRRHPGPGRGVGPVRVAAFCAGLLLLAAALFGPLEEYTRVSLAAHMIQHMVLLAAVPPLLLAGRPGIVGGALLAGIGRARSPRLASIRPVIHAGLQALRRSPWLAPLRHPLGAAGLQAAVLWGWHLPAAVALAAAHELAHVAMHGSFLAAGLVFWGALLRSLRMPADGPAAGFGAAAVAMLITMSHMGLLSALLTFASRPWYAPYASRPFLPGGLTPLEDQQLAGLLMWVPSAVPYLVGILFLTVLWLRALERRSASGRPIV